MRHIESVGGFEPLWIACKTSKGASASIESGVVRACKGLSWLFSSTGKKRGIDDASMDKIWLMERVALCCGFVVRSRLRFSTTSVAVMIADAMHISIKAHFSNVFIFGVWYDFNIVRV